MPLARRASSLPDAFVSATNLLFDDGLSNPHGGEYRAIAIRCPTLWRRDDAVATHGWVMPLGQGSSVRRAVAWNGLTYDVVTDVGPAYLNADIAALVKARSADPKSEPSRLQLIFAPDKDLVYNWRPLELTAACLLVRVGEVDLAKRIYSIAQSEAAEYPDSGSHLRRDPFVELADYWLGAIYDRTVQEHNHSDDRLAIDDSELIGRLSARLEAQSASRGAKVLLRSSLAQDAPSYFDFTTCAADILADSTRRSAAPQQKFNEAVMRSSHLSTAERVASLISHLDDVCAYEDMIPGSLRFDTDPVVEALIKEGDTAVAPLLDAMERDHRLTRVSRRERWSARSVPVLVSYAAYFCLTRILHTSDFGGTGNATVADIRAYWKVNRRLPLADRWFRTLSDDSATPDRWLEAAKNTVAPVGSNQDATWTRAPRRIYGSARPPMQGDLLKARGRPSVSALLAKRVATLAGVRPPNGEIVEQSTQFRDSITLALDLAAWDLKTSQPILRVLTRRSLAYARRAIPAGPTDGPGFPVGEMTLAQMHAGDPGAVTDYIKYIHEIIMSRSATPESELFLPLCEYPDNPVLAREAKRLFEGSKSRLNPVSRPFGASADTPGLDELIGSGLLCVPAFRRQVVRELDDHRLAGKGLVKEKLQLSWTRGGTGETGSCERVSDPYNRPPGTTFAFRLCDLYAWEVSRVCASVSPASKSPAAPRFELYWPEPQRDVAVAQMRYYLAHDGVHFRPADFP